MLRVSVPRSAKRRVGSPGLASDAVLGHVQRGVQARRHPTPPGRSSSSSVMRHAGRASRAADHPLKRPGSRRACRASDGLYDGSTAQCGIRASRANHFIAGLIHGRWPFDVGHRCGVELHEPGSGFFPPAPKTLLSGPALPARGRLDVDLADQFHGEGPDRKDSASAGRDSTSSVSPRPSRKPHAVAWEEGPLQGREVGHVEEPPVLDRKGGKQTGRNGRGGATVRFVDQWLPGRHAIEALQSEKAGREGGSTLQGHGVVRKLPTRARDVDERGEAWPGLALRRGSHRRRRGLIGA